MGEIRRPLLRWTILMVGAAWLLALAHPLLLYFGRGSLLPEQLPADLAFLFRNSEDLSASSGWTRIVIVGLVLPVMLTAFAVWYGSWLIAGEEERGSLSLLLAGPMLRQWVIGLKFSVLLLLIFVPSAAIWLALSLLAWIRYLPGEQLFINRASMSLFLLGLAFGTLALALGSLTGKYSLSRNISLAIALVTLLLYRLPVNFPGRQIFQLFSPYHYYGQAVFDQLFFPHAGVLALLAGCCLVLAWTAFEHRDLPV